MITKQTAQKSLAAIKVGNQAAQKIFASLNKSNGNLTASSYQVRAAEVKELKLLANNVCKRLAASFKSVDDINKAMKINAVNQLLADAAQMRLTAEILDEVLEESDELAKLPDESEEEAVESEDEDESVELPDESEEEAVESEDEDESVELPDESEDDDESVEADVDVIDPNDASDDIVEEVSAKRNYKKLRAKSAKAVRASSNSFGFNWNFGKSGR